MIYACSKPIEEYEIEYNGITMGLYTSYGHDKSFLALIMLFTHFPYDYEVGTVEPGEVRVQITKEAELRGVLNEMVEGVEIRTLLKAKNPLEFYEFIKDTDLSHLSIVDTFYNGSQDMLKVFIGARTANWALNYRGKMFKAGNVTQVSFGGVKAQAFEVSEELKQMNKTLKEQLYGSSKV